MSSAAAEHVLKLNIVKRRPCHCWTGSGFFARFLSFLMRGLNNLPLSCRYFCGLSPDLSKKTPFSKLPVKCRVFV
jgi:hypothetical protein